MLINAKLAFGKHNLESDCVSVIINHRRLSIFSTAALSDHDVWADGLLVFYEIFRFLEQHVPVEHLPAEFHRTEAFETDLNFYLGIHWRDNYEIRESVGMYLKHLQDVCNREPLLLLPYVYHLYMGLLSGGQILQKKRSFSGCLNPLSGGTGQGEAVTRFPDNTIAHLKTRMRSLFDDLAADFDESMKVLMVAESKMVFHLNNELVHSVRGVNRVNMQKFGIVIMVIVAIYYIWRWTK